MDSLQNRETRLDITDGLRAGLSPQLLTNFLCLLPPDIAQREGPGYGLPHGGRVQRHIGLPPLAPAHLLCLHEPAPISAKADMWLYKDSDQHAIPAVPFPQSSYACFKELTE